MTSPDDPTQPDLVAELEALRERVAELEHALERRGELEDELRRERDRARLYLDIAGVVLVVIDRDETVGAINRMGCDVLGHAHDQIVGSNWFDNYLPERLRENVREVFRQLVAGNVEPVEHYDNPVLNAAGDERMIAWHNTLLRDGNGTITGTLSSGLDVTERVQAEEALRQSEHRFQMMGEVMPLMFWMVSPDWQGVTYVSRAAETVYGRSPEAFYANPSLWFESIHPEDRDHVLEFYREHHGEATELEYRILRPGGAERWIRDVAAPLRDARGELVQLMGFGEDITERKRAQSQLQASLREKDVLLRELHHRVKNNLQVISSLIDFQCDALEDAGLATTLKDLLHRIRSMAFIHEHLHRFADLARVDVDDLVHSVVEKTLQAYGAQDRLVTSVHVDPIRLAVDQVVPCGLALGELVSNVAKHAFPDQPREDSAAPHRLTVELRAHEPASISLSVSDNGVGLPPDLDWYDSPSLGLQLVDSLVQHLEGEATVERVGGTSVKITFPSGDLAGR
jgi:PAS domain S-box-containing protein